MSADAEQQRQGSTIKIEIQIDEETAACIWADHTVHGRWPRSLPEIVKDVVESSAIKFKQAFPGAVPSTVKLFRAAHAAVAQPERKPGDRCTHTLRAKGVAYPRTCEECGLGPCRYGHK